MKNMTLVDIRVADEAWIALALLHRENPRRESFSMREIVDRVRREQAHPDFRPGIQPHISLHNVANLPPNPARYRLFYKLPDVTYRLYRPGDDSHPGRTGKIHPDPAGLPQQYRTLVDWYENEYCSAQPLTDEDDPILKMSGVGRELWADVDADEYVSDLRRGWESPELPGMTKSAVIGRKQ
jgi:hypothetical protein